MSQWPTALLGDVAEIERAIVAPEAIDSGTRYVGLEHITSDGYFNAPPLVNGGELASAKFAFGPSHVLYGKLRPYLSKIARPDFSGVCSTDILPIRAGTRLDRDYLHHFLRQPEVVALAASRSSGANLPRLSPGVLAEFSVPLPPLAEQRHIAEVLDRAETLRAQRRQALAQLDALAEAIFLDMFGDPIGNPKNWPKVELGELGDVQGGLQLSASRSSLPVEVPYLRVANVHRNRLDLSEIKSFHATAAEVERTLLQAGDVLIVEGHGNADEIGRCALWDGSIAGCSHQNHLIRLRPDPGKALPLFVARFLNSTGGRRGLLSASNTTSGLNTISVGKVRACAALLPPLTLQQMFSDRLSRVDILLATQQRAAAELDALFSSLQHRAFRGEL